MGFFAFGDTFQSMNETDHQLYSGATPAQVAHDLASLVDFQMEGVETAVLQKMLTNQLIPHLMRYDSPQFQSMFNAFLSDEGMLGAQLALEYNQGITNWQVSPGGATLEELCTQALCRLFNLDKSADATFMYSGTYANEQAIYLALHRHAAKQGFDLAQQGIAGFKNPERLAIFISEDAHFSLRHAVRITGLGEACLIKVPVDQNRRLDISALNVIIEKTKQTRDIVCIVATSGTTSTGAIDPIREMAALCTTLDVWFHIDGAYGYAYKLVPEWAHFFEGDGLADSISWDPHKQLGAPIPSSVLFVRNWQDLGRISLYSAYFNREEDVEPNPGLKSPPSTRSMAALPLVTILRGQGLRRIIDELRVPLTAVKKLAVYLQDQPDIELCHQPDTGILCFRMTPATIPQPKWEALQRTLYDKVMASGKRSISITKLDGKTVLRVVSVSKQTAFSDYLDTIAALRKLVGDKQ